MLGQNLRQVEKSENRIRVSAYGLMRYCIMKEMAKSKIRIDWICDSTQVSADKKVVVAWKWRN